jgi:endonuclease/exonuclease/phosphatase family metal-dependent hydrolase
VRGTRGPLNGLDVYGHAAMFYHENHKEPAMTPPYRSSLAERDSIESLPVAGTGERRLRLLTYNIQTGIATSRYRHYLTHSWKHVLPCSGRRDNLDRIADMVRHYDIVGLQEADAGSLRSGYINLTEYLATRAGFPHWYDQTNRNFGMFAQHSMGVLSRLRAAEIREHRLPGAIPGRGALVVQYGHGRETLALMIVHLALGKRARMRQLGFIGEIASAHRHVILMGDLNCRSDSPELGVLIDRVGLREPTHDLHTFPSWRPIRNIDHILVSPSLRVEEVSVLNYPLSDHLPISMEISLPDDLELGGRHHANWDRNPVVAASL